MADVTVLGQQHSKTLLAAVFAILQLTVVTCSSPHIDELPATKENTQNVTPASHPLSTSIYYKNTSETQNLMKLNKVAMSQLTTITATAAIPPAHQNPTTGAEVIPEGSKPIKLNSSVAKSTNSPESKSSILTDFSKEDLSLLNFKSTTSPVEMVRTDNTGYEEENGDEYARLGENSVEDSINIIKDIAKDFPERARKIDIHMKETTIYATQDEDSHFFLHLVIIALLVAIMYITYHNKKKDYAPGSESALEGRPLHTQHRISSA